MLLPLASKSSGTAPYVSLNPPPESKKGTSSRVACGLASSYSSIEKFLKASNKALNHVPADIKSILALRIQVSYTVTVDGNGNIKPVPYKPVKVMDAYFTHAAPPNNDNTPSQTASISTQPSVDRSIGKKEMKDIEAPGKTVKKPTVRNAFITGISNAGSYLKKIVQGRPANYSKLMSESSDAKSASCVIDREALFLKQSFEKKIQESMSKNSGEERSSTLHPPSPFREITFKIQKSCCPMTEPSGKADVVAQEKLR